MRVFDHERQPGYLAAFREISRRAQLEDAAIRAEQAKRAKVITPDFTRAVSPALVLKRRMR